MKITFKVSKGTKPQRGDELPMLDGQGNTNGTTATVESVTGDELTVQLGSNRMLGTWQEGSDTVEVSTENPIFQRNAAAKALRGLGDIAHEVANEVETGKVDPGAVMRRAKYFAVRIENLLTRNPVQPASLAPPRQTEDHKGVSVEIHG